MLVTLVILVTIVGQFASAQVTPGVYFTKLGGNGSYNTVTKTVSSGWPPPCSETNPCQKTNTTIKATPLAPFNEEVALQLRGPMDLKKIAVYTASTGGFTLTSYWERGAPSKTTNMAFLSLSGDWTVCQGNAVGYTNATANGASSTPQILQGYLAEGLEITVLSSVACNNDCGFYRGVGLHGWAGDKIFVVETTMPNTATKNIPAIWSLNAKIIRTGQYGCNCDRNGCGEFDIAEVLPNEDSNKAFMTLYSYNGALGTPAYFVRPVSTPSVFLTHYSIQDNRIYALNLPSGCFTYGNTVTSSYISNLQSISVDAASFATKKNTNATFSCAV